MLSMDRKHKYRTRKRSFSNRTSSIWKRRRVSSINRDPCTVEVTADVVEILRSMCQKSGTENGGILLGSQINEKYYRINRASEPCLLMNSSTRCGCIRDANKANEIIKHEFISSNRKRVYLGEWHTHPENFPTPSVIDIASVYDIFHKSKLAIEGVFLVIIGYKSIYWGFHDGLQMHEIQPILI